MANAGALKNVAFFRRPSNLHCTWGHQWSREQWQQKMTVVASYENGRNKNHLYPINLQDVLPGPKRIRPTNLEATKILQQKKQRVNAPLTNCHCS